MLTHYTDGQLEQELRIRRKERLKKLVDEQYVLREVEFTAFEVYHNHNEELWPFRVDDGCEGWCVLVVVSNYYDISGKALRALVENYYKNHPDFDEEQTETLTVHPTEYLYGVNMLEVGKK